MALHGQLPAYASSFRAEWTIRPSGYLTPPPPDVEPLSPTIASSANPPGPSVNNKKRKACQAQLHDVFQTPSALSSANCSSGHAHRASAPSHIPYPHQQSIMRHFRPSTLDTFSRAPSSPSVPQSDLSFVSRRNDPHSQHGLSFVSANNSWSAKQSNEPPFNAPPRPSTSYAPRTTWEDCTPHPPYNGEVPRTEATPFATTASSTNRTHDNLHDAELLLGFALGRDFKSTLRTLGPIPLASLVPQPTTGPAENYTGVAHDASLPDRVYESVRGKESPQCYKERSTFENNNNELSPSQPEQSVLAQSGLRKLAEVPQDVDFGGVTGVRPAYNNVAVESHSPPTVAPPSAKPRVHKGWPKGKPRGSKSTALPKPSRNTVPKPHPFSSAAATLPANDNLPNHVAKTSQDQNGTILSEKLKCSQPSPVSPPRYHLPGSPTLANMGPQLAPIRKPNEQKPMIAIEYAPIADSRNSTYSAGTHIVSAPQDSIIEGKDDGQTNLCGACRSNSTRNGFNDLWITCNGCKVWFHTACVGFENERKVRDVDKFYCEDCAANGSKTTYVRKSSRAHVSVDYAGLNEGKVRTATDTVEHHYIQPFKDGTIDLQPESFPRMRPELVTAEFFERSGTMSEPVLIPAEWNPRPSMPGQGFRLHQGPETALAEPLGKVGEWFNESVEFDCVPDDGQDRLGMIMPHGLTVRRVADLVGPDERVEVIDVKSQEGGDNRWNLRKWAEYYEAEGEKPVRNVISLEVSQTKLGKLVRRPQIVRDLDLQDAVWPQDELAKGNYPQVQFYCLMSVQDCFTDFHIDFGGSSVYYHILKGKKTFFFIPPKKQHLKAYEQWCLSSNQGFTFLGDVTKECYRVDLAEGDTMLIPSGWIHAVWTPANSLVIGGNFLTRMHYGMQIQINDIEKNTGVGRRFRYPHFQKVLWYAVIQYLQEDPVPSTVAEQLYKGEHFHRPTPVYDNFYQDGDVLPENYNSRYYSRGEVDGLGDLMRYIFRTVMISVGKVQGVSKTTQEAVIRSLPKGYGEHLDLLKTFALWVAWKRGNEPLPAWAHPDFPASDMEMITTEKKSKPERELPLGHATPERRSQRQNTKEKDFASQPGLLDDGDALKEPSDLPKSAPGPRRIACEACRKRRIRCKHKETDELQAGPAKRFGIKTIFEPTTQSTPAPLPNSHQPWAPVAVLIPPRQDSRLEARPPSGTSCASAALKAKACDECRKSKRRCIHDENGNVDPVRAVQPPVPRAFSQKRPRPENDAGTLSAKKPKIEDDVGQFSNAELGTIVSAARLDAQKGRIQLTDPVGSDPHFKDELTQISLRQQAQFEMGYGCPSNGLDFSAQHKGSQETPRQAPDATMHVLREDSSPAVDALVAIPGNAYQPNRQGGVYSPSTIRSETCNSADVKHRNTSSLADQTISDLSVAGESRSRTSSLHVQTNSTESVGASGSVPSSPLTDLGPSSPARHVEDPPSIVLVKPKQENEDAIGSHTVGTEAASPTLRQNWKLPATSEVPHDVSRRQNSARQTSGSSSMSRASSIAHRKASSLGSRRLSTSLDPDEEESRKLAQELQDEEFGLRRRS